MAKRTAKTPAPPSAPGAKVDQFQIPEDSPHLPSPWDEIASTVPRVPDPGGTTPASPPGLPRSKPMAPTGEYDYDPDDVQRAKPNLLYPTLVLKRPALGRMSTLGTSVLGDCAIANALGTREPTRALISFSADRKWLYIMPVAPRAGKAVDITYQRKMACINFWGPFEESGKVVQKGYSEYYRLEMTEEPVTIHGVKGYSLYTSLEDFQSEEIQQRDGIAVTPSNAGADSSENRTAAAKRKATKAQTRSNLEPSGASSATSQPSADEEDDELPDALTYELLLKERDDMLAAYEKKFGKL